MNIHVSKNGVQLGTFSEAEVRAKLASGEIATTDLAWREGLGEWQPVGTLLGGETAAPPPIPTSVPIFEGTASAPVIKAQETSGLAIGSMICGIVGLVSFVPSIAAVVMGHIALSRIKRSGGVLGGKGMAIIGLITGYLVVAIFPVAMIAAIMVPTYNLINAQANQMKAASNCRQIITLMQMYAADHNGAYPDSVENPLTGKMPLTSNDAFRALFQEDLTQEEKIFGSPSSKFIPDGNIGSAPNYDQALIPGENHWAMTKGQSTSSPGQMPLVFENPAAAGWPPQWNANAAGRPVQGRAWQGGKIVIGKNDTSVETIRLQSAHGDSVGPRMLENGLDIFTGASVRQPLEMLNIAIGRDSQ